ncbi:glutamate mutase L [Natranaerofaba carboxydovora]|uniref:glutamate mutase L n=1 Tax=Natranaerofaba carboxydovora TaxID=2742683 RepID=UPI001F129A8C|nr:glutamate mutase L [Natranaerofaba carboxydovora]UMZ73059.1 MutL protein [Natranaerofaba carboxydovora]
MPDIFLVIEVGSTTTVLSLFSYEGELLYQYQYPTTTEDITEGVYRAYSNIKNAPELKERGIELDDNMEQLEVYATSSAAGGLKMTVHGLVCDMTVRAAKEAAFGAGAVISQITAGEMDEYDIKRLLEIDPNIILLAGGVDFGEEDIVLKNAHKISKAGLKVPVIYAGNSTCREKIKDIFDAAKIPVIVVDNVYPELDELNITPTRKAIQKVFQEHIIKGEGIEKLKELTGKNIMPTPGAVFEGGNLLYELVGDLLIIDVGGATTDVHSFTNGSIFYEDLLTSPEPFSKRTVEGDLGVYKNAVSLLEKIRETEELNQLESDIDYEETFGFLDNWSYIPQTKEEEKLLNTLTYEAVNRALKRHSGKIKHRYSATGRKKVMVGKDLTAVKWVVGTGGALTLQKTGKDILRQIIDRSGKDHDHYNDQGGENLLPPKDTEVILDKNYILAASGVVGRSNKDLALKILKNYFVDTLNKKMYTGKVY